MATRRLSHVAGGLAGIVTGSAAGQGLVLLSYPVLARLYDPAEFGLLTVFTSLVGMLGILSTASLEAAVPLPRDDDAAAAVAWSGLAFAAVTSLLTVAVGFVAAGPVAELLGVPGLATVWWLMPPTILVLGVYAVTSEWMVRERSYAALGRRNLLQGLGQVVTQVGLGAAGVRPVGLLLGLGVGRLFAVGGLVSGKGLLRRRWPGLAAMRAAVRRYRRFPLLAAPSSFVNSAGLEVPLLLVSALYGDARAGLLGLTVRVVGGPSSVVGQAVHQVFMGESSARLRESVASMGATVRGAARRLLLVGALPALVLAAAGPPLFELAFGPEWGEAGHYARFLVFAYLAQFVVTPISSTLFLLERQGQELVWGGVRLLLTAGGPLVCGLMGAPMTAAVVAMAVGGVLSYGILYVLCVRAADASDRSPAAG